MEKGHILYATSSGDILQFKVNICRSHQVSPSSILFLAIVAGARPSKTHKK